MYRSLRLFCLAPLMTVYSCKHTPDTVERAEFFETYPMVSDQVAGSLLVDDSGAYILGTSGTGGSSVMLLMRTDLNGKLLWTRSIGIRSEGFGMAHTPDGGLILIGSHLEESTKNILLVRTDSDGTVLWERSIGGAQNDLGRDVIALTQGGFMILGTTSSHGPGVANMYVARTDDEGNPLWFRSFGGMSVDGGSELVEVDAYQVMLFGFTESLGPGQRDLWLQSVSVDGDSLWSSFYGGASYAESQAIVRTSDGGFALSAHSALVNPAHALLALKLDAAGNTLWEHHLGAPAVHSGGEGVCEDPDGHLLFVGTTYAEGLGEEILMVRTSAQGDLLQEELIGGEGDQYATDVQCSERAYLILGTSNTQGTSDILLIKKAR